VADRLISALSVAALAGLTLACLAFAISAVGNRDLDVPVGFLVAAAVLLLALPGFAWPRQKVVPLIAIGVVAATTASLSLYYLFWTLSCPSCDAGDDSRREVFVWGWQLLAFQGVAAMLVTGFGAAAAWLVRRITRPRIAEGQA
jgi:hypothetical protein